MSEIVLIRHGETTGNSAVRLNGATDVPLSDLGRRQAARAQASLVGERFDRLLVSPLTRSRQAGALAMPTVLPQVIAEFGEVDFGAWETWTWAEVEARDPAGFAAWTGRGQDFCFPGGDSHSGFRARVVAGSQAHLLTSTDRVVGALHKGVIKVILAHLLGRPFAEFSDYSVELGSIHRLRRGPASWELVGPAEVEHLGPDRCPGS